MFLAFSVGQITAARVSTGLAGWMRHLPVGGETQRRAVWATSLWASASVWIAVTVLVVAMARIEGQGLRVSGWRVAGLCLAAVAAAAAALPVRSWSARLAAFVAAGAGVWAQPWALAGGVVCLVLFDRFAGPLRTPRRWRVPRVGVGGGSLSLRIAWPREASSFVGVGAIVALAGLAASARGRRVLWRLCAGDGVGGSALPA